MTIKKPFHRLYRSIVKGENSGYSNWAYIIDKEYAVAPEHYVRAFLLIQKDIKTLFEYIEPSDVNLKTYSYKIHSLLIRTCIELEANFKAILRENIYTKKPEKDWNICDYVKVNGSHHLDEYKVKIPVWNGQCSEFQPFKDWKTKDGILAWYKIYNETKHNRVSKFCEANFEQLLNTIAGLFILLSSQFCTEDFQPGSVSLSVGGYSYYSGEFGIGDFFEVQFPTNWIDDEKYEFDWSKLKEENDRFQKYNYDEII
jgi:hypothetical protein